MKQTAVDWLHHKILNPTSHELLEDINLWFLKAKEMEKEQIEDAYWEGIFNGEFLDGQAYYNENYGQK